MGIELDMLDVGQAALGDPAAIVQAKRRPDVFLAPIFSGTVISGRCCAHRFAVCQVFSKNKAITVNRKA